MKDGDEFDEGCASILGLGGSRSLKRFSIVESFESMILLSIVTECLH